MKKKVCKNGQILEAATAEFLEHGVAAASMHKIAQNGQVSSRTLYKYYPSKQDLYDCLINQVLEHLEASYNIVFSEESSIENGIEKIIKAKIEFSLNDSLINITKIIMGEILKSKYPKPVQMSRLNKYEHMFTTWISLMQDSNKITSELDAQDISNQFHAILKADVYWPIIMGLVKKEDLDIEKIQKNAKSFFIKMYVTK